MKLYFTFLLTIGSILNFGESNFRTFIDSQVSGDDVYIERLDGLSTRVDISIFGKDDQGFIREWDRKETLRNDAIKARFITDVEDKSRWDNKQPGSYGKLGRKATGSN